jgi:excisionase family DNA binding protein
MEDYITIEQLAQLLGIKKNTAYKLSSKKLLTKFKPGGKIVLFKVGDAIKYVESKRIASQQEIKQSVLKKIFSDL